MRSSTTFRAAQTFIRRGKLGIWPRLLTLAQEQADGIELGMTFPDRRSASGPDGTNVRTHAKAAGAPKAAVRCPDFVYCRRNRIKRMWARLKDWAAKRTDRAVATRYEKTAPAFMGVLCLAATMDQIKS